MAGTWHCGRKLIPALYRHRARGKGDGDATAYADAGRGDTAFVPSSPRNSPPGAYQVERHVGKATGTYIGFKPQ